MSFDLISLDPVGFWIPLVISVFFSQELLKKATLLDLVLMLAAMAISFVTLNIDTVGIHMVEAYIGVIIFYVIKSLEKKQLSPGCSIAMFFTSMVIPDLYGAIYHSNGQLARVGGDGFKDGLFLWPILSGVFYGLVLKMQSKSKESTKNISV